MAAPCNPVSAIARICAVVWLLCVLVTGAQAQPMQESEQPAQKALPRVMSTNVCADALLMALAEPSQITSVFYKSQDARYSSLHQLAQGFTANRASMEEVVMQRPDVVLASRRWQGKHQHALLKRFGIRVVSVPYPKNWQEIADSTMQVARLLQREQAGVDLVARMQTVLQKTAVGAAVQRDAEGLQAKNILPKNALYLRPNGYTAGSNTYIDAVLAAAGLRNHAAEHGLQSWGRVPLEKLVMQPPQVLVTSHMRHDSTYAKSAFSRHAVVQKMAEQAIRVQLAASDMGCSDWRLLAVAEQVHNAVSAEAGR